MFIYYFNKHDISLILDNGPVSIPITRTASLPTPRPPYLVQMKRSATLTGDVPDIRVSLIEAKSQPQLRGSTNSSIKNYHPSSDICCDGPPQSPFSVTSSSTNEDTRYNILSRSLSSSTDYLNSNYGDVIPRPEVDKSERSSSWSEGARIHNVSPSKSSETLPEARNHKPSCIPKKNGYKCTSPSKSSDVSLSPVAERVYIAEINNGDGLVMKALSEEVSDKGENREVPPLSEVKVINKPKAAECQIHRGINVHFIPLHCDIYHNHNMSLSRHMHSFSL